MSFVATSVLVELLVERGFSAEEARTLVTDHIRRAGYPDGYSTITLADAEEMINLIMSGSHGQPSTRPA